MTSATDQSAATVADAPPPAAPPRPAKSAAGPMPTVGRIVHYTPMGAGKGGQPYPAVITHVWTDTCVNLHVLADGSHELSQVDVLPASVTLATEPGQPRSWSWPQMAA